ncbi:MAG: 16S rRNA (cytosine(1402)-N(4))-methyltransferase RsmH [Azospirillaceae bacterium]|nr:16S rRNA (cytosine(1402)-N(4))-methyltransferase RsmH [Azospirillaceae bacterium]
MTQPVLPPDSAASPALPAAAADVAAHLPVMRDEIVAALAPRAGGCYVDGTFGEGGYSRAIAAAADCQVWGLDRDPRAAAFAARLGRETQGRVEFVAGCFGAMEPLLRERHVVTVDGVVLDLGVSSPQIDQAERGFSFRLDGPLDMRMGDDGPTAADAVNTLPEAELARILWELGDERFSRRIARAIVETRLTTPYQRTLQLAETVRRVVPRSRDGIDPATRTFQALRIHVNDELGELDRGLAAAERLLAPGGRLVVVSFHSLEDRRVKSFLRQRALVAPAPSRHAPQADGPAREPSFRLITQKPAVPGALELSTNPRARSARLRVAERTTAHAWPHEVAA